MIYSPHTKIRLCQEKTTLLIEIYWLAVTYEQLTSNTDFIRILGGKNLKLYIQVFLKISKP